MTEQNALFTTELITLEDVSRVYPPKPLLGWHPPIYEGATLAVGRAIYEYVPQRAVDAWTSLVVDLAREFAPGNLWLLPTYARLPYPYAVFWPLASAFRTEKESGRRFDWFVWMDDDVIVTKADIRHLLAAAQAHDLKFIAACPYDRCAPYSPSIVEKVDGTPFKWVKAPPSGSYPVAMTGFNLCLFRRDIFDIVPEPWFGVCAPTKGFSGVAPDWWWSIQMEKAGLQPWVCCDTNVIHLRPDGESCRKTSEEYYATHNVAESGMLEDRQIYTSPNSGAMMTRPPKFRDGRMEYELGTNMP